MSFFGLEEGFLAKVSSSHQDCLQTGKPSTESLKNHLGVESVYYIHVTNIILSIDYTSIFKKLLGGRILKLERLFWHLETWRNGTLYIKGNISLLKIPW